jgi:radical SAM superfamily enzyme YgiQ (UPF0313 family)
MKNQGENVEVLDLNGEKDLNIPGGYTHYGITCLTPNMPRIKKICEIIRKNSPSAIIILGGPHITVTGLAKSQRSKKDWEEILKISDVQVIGTGATCFSQGTIFNDKPLTEDIIPLRSAIKLEDYHYEIDGKKATSIIAQSGCPFNCSFCSGRGTKTYRSAVRRSTESIINEIAELEELGYRGIMMYDDEINVNKKAFTELLQALIVHQEKTGIELSLRGFSRADLLTYEEAYLMRKAGFRWLLVGFESGSNEMLKSMNKGVTVDQNTKAIDIARAAGLKVKALMSIGHPGESFVTIFETKKWLLKVRPDEFDLTIVSVYPGTPYYEDAVNKGGVWVYTSPDEKKLYSKDINFVFEESNYKGRPGEYNCHVWTDYLGPKELIKMRDEMEKSLKNVCN